MQVSADLAALADRRCDLNYASRLSWGVNFITGTPATMSQQRMKEGGPLLGGQLKY